MLRKCVSRSGNFRMTATANGAHDHLAATWSKLKRAGNYPHNLLEHCHRSSSLVTCHQCQSSATLLMNHIYVYIYINPQTGGKKRKICSPHSCKDMEKDGDVGKCWSLVSGATLLNNVSETMQQVAGSNNFIWISFSTEPNRHAYYTMCAALWRLRLSKKARG